MTVVIDRFENDFAVAELPEGGYVNIPKVLVSGASEGDLVHIEIESGKYESEKRINRLHSLFK